MEQSITRKQEHIPSFYTKEELERSMLEILKQDDDVDSYEELSNENKAGFHVVVFFGNVLLSIASSLKKIADKD